MKKALQGLRAIKRYPAGAWRRLALLANALRSPLLLQALRGPRPGPADASPEIVMVVISNLRIDPRVLREAKTLASAGYRVKILYPDTDRPYFVEQALDWGPGISFRPLPWQAAAFQLEFPWVCATELLAAASEERPFAFHCHDLNTALVGLAAAHRVGAYCVCDFHEWFSENVSWNAARECYAPHPWLKKQIYRLIERVALRRANAVVTVCDSIAVELNAIHGGRPVQVIRNIPDLAASTACDYPPLKKQLGLRCDQFVLLWQGGTGPTRLIEPIIEALQYAPGVVFVIRGPSLDLFGEGYRSLAEKCGVADRLVLVPPVPSTDVVAAARGADAGIWTLPKLSRNFYYALPNKIFEYMAARIPVLAANYPEARRMVEGNGVGLCFDPYDPRSIAAQINRLGDEPGLVAPVRAAFPGALRHIDADNEWQKLVDIYRRLQRGEAA